MSPKLLITAILLTGALRSAAQDPDLIPYMSDSTKNGLDIYRTDTVPYTEPVVTMKKRYYLILEPLTGISTLLTPHNDGIFNVSFPYNVGGPADTFYSGDQRAYGSSKVFTLPVGLEIGTWNQFIDVDLEWSSIGNWRQGFGLSLGYGRNFYLGGHSVDIERKALVIKPSINFVWMQDGGHNAGAQFGSIDNTGITIRALGYTAGPTYDVTNDDYDANGNYIGSSTSTNDASTLDITYVQTQYAVRPEITLSNNPYRKRLHWEFSLGYDLTLSERGGISLKQDGSHTIANLIDLDHPGLTATYNGRPIHSTPYHFSGFYLRFAFGFAGYENKNL